jgi:hypothetical protein
LREFFRQKEIVILVEFWTHPLVQSWSELNNYYYVVVSWKGRVKENAYCTGFWALPTVRSLNLLKKSEISMPQSKKNSMLGYQLDAVKIERNQRKRDLLRP